MNTQLIPLVIGELNSQSVQLVNARDLHSFLESKQDFSDWIKKRISEYDFIENVDFCSINLWSKPGSGGHNRIEYHISTNMAKELGMVERNEKGRQIRRYFLEMERIAHSRPVPLLRETIAQVDTKLLPGTPALARDTLLMEPDHAIDLAWDFITTVPRIGGARIMREAGVKDTIANWNHLKKKVHNINMVFGYPVVKR